MQLCKNYWCVIENSGSYQKNVPKFLAAETGLIVESPTDNLSK